MRLRFEFYVFSGGDSNCPETTGLIVKPVDFDMPENLYGDVKWTFDIDESLYLTLWVQMGYYLVIFRGMDAGDFLSSLTKYLAIEETARPKIPKISP